MGWTTMTWNFTTVSSTTTLEFDSLDSLGAGYSGFYGPALDNVIVAAVPEPSTGLLVTAGVLGIALGRRRILFRRE